MMELSSLSRYSRHSITSSCEPEKIKTRIKLIMAFPPASSNNRTTWPKLDTTSTKCHSLKTKSQIFWFCLSLRVYSLFEGNISTPAQFQTSYIKQVWTKPVTYVWVRPPKILQELGHFFRVDFTAVIAIILREVLPHRMLLLPVFQLRQDREITIKLLLACRLSSYF